MNEYHKIQTVFLRDPETRFKTLLAGEYALPEFEFLKDNEWVFTEKVDGTNIRVMVNPESGVTFGGKTDRANIPAPLANALVEQFIPLQNTLAEMFGDGACLYGEGYGARIQKGGGNYRTDQGFVLFDVRVGDFWLQRSDVESVAQQLGVDVVPILGFGTLDTLVQVVAQGFDSMWGDFPAEGVVARPAIELKTRGGKRIITKLKTRDFTGRSASPE